MQLAKQIFVRKAKEMFASLEFAWEKLTSVGEVP
jgi:hypothetical protein